MIVVHYISQISSPFSIHNVLESDRVRVLWAVIRGLNVQLLVALLGRRNETISLTTIVGLRPSTNGLLNLFSQWLSL